MDEVDGKKEGIRRYRIVLEEVEKCGIGNVQNHFSAVF